MMKPTKFKEANTVFGANQEEYLDLPGYINPEDPFGQLITCWQLSIKERLKLLFTGTLWLSQLTFNRSMQPQRPDINSPFSDPTDI